MMQRLLGSLLITSIAVLVSNSAIAQGPGGGGGGPGRGGPGGRGRGMDAANGAQALAANNALAANAQAANGQQRGNQAGGRQQDGNLQDMAKMMIASFDTNGDGALNATELQAALAGLRDMMQSQQKQGGGQMAGMQAANAQNAAGLAAGDGPGMPGGSRGRPQGPGGRR